MKGRGRRRTKDRSRRRTSRRGGRGKKKKGERAEREREGGTPVIESWVRFHASLYRMVQEVHNNHFMPHKPAKYIVLQQNAHSGRYKKTSKPS